jgi:hypothetical protein
LRALKLERKQSRLLCAKFRLWQGRPLQAVSKAADKSRWKFLVMIEILNFARRNTAMSLSGVRSRRYAFNSKDQLLCNNKSAFDYALVLLEIGPCCGM